MCARWRDSRRASPPFPVVPAAIGLLLHAAAAASAPSFEYGGLLFGDAYYVDSHHTTEGDGARGAVLRRGYLTIDSEFTEHWSGRLRFEFNQDGEFEVYELDARVKDFYVARDIPRHRILIGLSPTPTFDLVEGIWGARYLARTPLDLQGEPSRDSGLAARGELNAAGTLQYRAMIGGGLGFGKDSAEEQRLMAAISFRPASDWVFDFYAGEERVDDGADSTLISLFAGFDAEPLRFGLQYSKQDRGDEPALDLASAFLVRDFGEKLSLIARVDRLFEPSVKADDIDYLPYSPDAAATTLIAGVEFRLAPHLRLTPNAVVTEYDRDEQGLKPDSDLHLRLTLFLDFE